MRVTILGAGQYYLTPGDLSLYNATGQLVETSDAKIIMDFGRGCLRSLTQLGISVHEIDLICISHLHPDHVADLLPFFQAHFVERKLKQTSGKQLTIIGPVGTKQWFETVAQLLYEPLSYQPLILEDVKQSTFGALTVNTTLLQHLIPNLGYRISDGAHSVTYSGDTGYTVMLSKFAHNTDLLILEAANVPEVTSPVHLNALQCGQIATEAGAKRLLLTHYGSSSRETELRRATAQTFDGILTLGKELLTIELS